MVAAFSVATWYQLLPKAILRTFWWQHPKDWILHVCLYGGATWLLLLAALNRHPPGTVWRRRWMWLVPMTMLIWGVFDELGQGFFGKYRTADLFDWLFDAIGIIGCAVGVYFWEGRQYATTDLLKLPPDLGWTVKQSAQLVVRLHANVITKRLGLQARPDLTLAAALQTVDTEELARIFYWSAQPELALRAWRDIQYDSTQVGKPDERFRNVQAICQQAIHFQHSLDLRREHALQELLAAWVAADIQVAPFKGSCLAWSLGQPPGMRPAGDLDFCLLPSDLPVALKVLSAAGAEPITSDPAALDYMRNFSHDYSLRHPTLGLIELHTRLYPDMPADALERVWSRTRQQLYLGHPIRMFDAADLYVLLSQHLFLHGWLDGMKWNIDLLPFHLAFEAEAAGQRPDATNPWPPALEGFSIAAVHAAAIDLNAVFPLMAQQAIMGRLLDRMLPVELQASLRSHLTKSEIEALSWIESPAGLDQSTDWMLLEARRRNRGRYTKASWRATLVPHPGKIAMELGIRSDAPGFRRQRFYWLLRRMRRALIALCGFPSRERIAPNAQIADLAASTPPT